jgi:hypothetical protein
MHAPPPQATSNTPPNDGSIWGSPVQTVHALSHEEPAVNVVDVVPGGQLVAWVSGFGRVGHDAADPIVYEPAYAASTRPPATHATMTSSSMTPPLSLMNSTCNTSSGANPAGHAH